MATFFGKLRPYLNKVVVADEPGYSTTEIVVVRPFRSYAAILCARISSPRLRCIR